MKRAVTEAHKLLDDLLSQEMDKLGLSIGEADMLTVIHVADYDPVPSEVADWLSLTKAGITGRLNTLERRGFIKRRPNPADGRSVTVHLTAAGSSLAVDVLKAKNATIMNTVVRDVGTETVGRLIADLDATIAAARSVLEQSS